MKNLIIILILFAYCISNAQDDKWLNFNTSENIIALMSMDDFVWVGTGGGLVSVNINDNSISWYNKGNSIIPSNNVRALAKDSTGNLWVGTDNGLIRISGKEWTLFDKNNSDIPSNAINCIAAAANGDIFIGTANAGLVKLSNSEFTSIELTHDDSIIFIILSIAIDKNQILWVSGNGSRKGSACSGLFKFSNGNAEYIENKFKNMKCDNMGNLYAFDNGAIYKLKADTLDLIYYFPYYYYAIRDICFHGNDKIFIGFDKHGLVTYDINSDKTDFLWAYEDFPVKIANCFTHDKESNIWVGTRIGLYKYDGSRFENIYISNSTQRASIRSQPKYYRSEKIYIDKNNTYHLIMPYYFSNDRYYKGIASFDGKKWAFSDVYDKRFPILHYSLDSDSTFWGGNGNKLLKYEKGDWALFDSTSGYMNAGNFIDIEKDIDGNLWVITEKDQLLKFDGEKWIEINSNNSILPMEGFERIGKEPNGDICIITEDALYFLDDGQWHKFIKEGNRIQYSYDRFYKVFFENDSTFWVSNYRGVSKYVNYELSEEIYNGLTNGFEFSTVTDFKKVGEDEYWLLIDEYRFRDFPKDMPRYYVFHYIHHSKGEEKIKYDLGGQEPMSMFFNTKLNPAVIYQDSVYVFNDSTWIKLTHENSRFSKSYLQDVRYDKYDNLLVSFGNDLFIYNENGIIDIEANPLLPPQPPFNLKLEQDSLDIKLSWDSNTSENVEYSIYKRKENDPYFHLIAENITERSFEDKVEYETTYHYSIKSESTETGMESIFSNIVKCEYIWKPEKKWRLFNESTSHILHDVIYSVAIDSSGYLWYGTEGNGFGVYNGQKWEQKFCRQTVRALEVNNDNVVWATTAPLSFVRDAIVQQIDLPDWTYYLTDFAFHRKYDLWLVGYSGLISYYPETNSTDYFDQPYVSAAFIDIDRNGVKWLALDRGGVASMKTDNTWKYYNIENSNLPSNDMMGLDIDSKNNVWVSTRAGLSKFDGSDFINYGGKSSIIAADRFNNIWGYFDYTIVKFDGRAWKYYYDLTDNMPILNVTDICIDKYDNKWFANYDGGIVVFNENGLNVKGSYSQKDTTAFDYDDISLFPVPAEDFVVVSLSPEKTYSIVVYDILGNIIYSVDKLTEKKEHRINLDQWSNNVYIIKVISGNHVFGKVFIKK
jgi:ligand-binding sensor domain-containing protein